MNKNYLKYLFKQRKVALIFFLIIYIGICMTPYISFGDIEESFRLIAMKDAYFNSATIGIVMSTMLAFALPVLQLSYVHRRRSVDQYFALPVSRKAQIITEIVFMASVCIGYFLVISLAAYVIFALRAVPFIRVLALIGQVSLFLLEMILINSFFYLLANNIFDGIVVTGAYTCLPVLLYMVIFTVMDTVVAGYSSGGKPETAAWYLSPIAMGIDNISSIMNPEVISAEGGYNVSYLICGIVLALLACFGLKKQFVDRKTERAEQLSDEFFAYRFIIHAYLIGILVAMGCSLKEIGLANMVVYYLMLFLVYVIAHFVYMRKIRLKVSYIAVFIAAAAATAGVAEIGWKTKGFGLAENYELFADKYLVYDYSAYVYGGDLGQRLKIQDDKAENYVDVSFRLTIPENEQEKYREQIELLEQVRKNSIEITYTGQDEEEYLRSAGWLNVNNTGRMDSADPYTNSFGYRIWTPLDEEELIKISEVTDVYIYDSYDGEEYALSEYLEKRGGKK